MIQTNPELLALIERARNHVMTKEERAEQRKSWTVGELMLSYPEMTRGETVAIYDRVI